MNFRNIVNFYTEIFFCSIFLKHLCIVLQSVCKKMFLRLATLIFLNKYNSIIVLKKFNML